ncbi:MAG: AAA family ATPase [Proteobacteria bacterium]|nr:MAG: AAA family ATPase [Pseudomonadota bacterium]QKK11637.1 MAG: AAA domain-containing protein [Pseudomonadota bacterium]
MRHSQVQQILEREFLSAAEGHHTPVMLWGPPGIGKSDMVRQVAERHGVPVIDLRLSQLEPSDLRGIPFRVEERVEWAIPALLPDSARQGARGILFLDEVNAAPPSVSAAAYQLILDRRLGEYQVPAGWAIFAAGNRQGDRAVTYVMPAPLANRFAHLEVEPHLDDWVAWAYASDIDERLIAFLRFRPDLLFDFDPAHNPTAFPSPRTWEFAHRALQKFDGDLLTGALQACVGEAAGLELAAFLRSLAQMPDVEAIARGESAEVPDGVDLQYAVATALVKRALAARASADSARLNGHLLDYARRFPLREMGVMLVVDLHRTVGPQICQLPQFKEWAQDVGHVILSDAEA